MEEDIPWKQPEEAGVAILISDKAYFRARKIVEGTDRHYTMRKRTIL